MTDHHGHVTDEIIGRIWRLAWRAAVCLATVLVVLLIGVGFHEHFSWAQAKIEAMEFLEVVRHAKIEHVLTALTTPWATLMYLALCIIAGELIGRRLDRKRSIGPRESSGVDRHDGSPTAVRSEEEVHVRRAT